MRLRPTLVAVLVVASVLGACGTRRSAAPPPIRPGQTVVSLEFDDATSSQWGARSLLSAHRLHATFFVVSGSVGTPGYLDWPQVEALAADGHEIGGHTVTHPHLAALSPDEARREICTGRNALLRRGFEVRNLAYPYGSFSPGVEQMARGCGYTSARTMEGTSQGGVRPADAYALGHVVVPSDATDLAALEKAVTDVESQGGGWVHLAFHRLCAGCDRFSTPLGTLGAFLDWLAPRQRSGTVVRTVGEVIGGSVHPAVDGPALPPPAADASNALPNASLEADGDGDGVPDCWSETGYGEVDARWTRTAEAHGGGAAIRLDVTSRGSGDRKLLVAQDLGTCSPTVRPEARYRVSTWYRSSAQPVLIAFSRDGDGTWSYWSESPPLPPAGAWTEATWTTPSPPPNATGLSVGVLLNTTGSVTVDELSLRAIPV